MKIDGDTMKIKAIIETAIYVDDLNAAEDFYSRILGLKMIRKEPDHYVFFQVGDSNVLLAFNPQATLKSDTLPPHGASGRSHFAMGIEADSLDAWREHLETQKVAVEMEVEWPPGGKSLYFRDPAGNLVELITPGIWELPSGW